MLVLYLVTNDLAYQMIGVETGVQYEYEYKACTRTSVVMEV